MKKTLRELLAQGINIVYIKSYGYNELSAFGNIWQPFGNIAKYIPFEVDSNGHFTKNRTLFFDEDEPTLEDVFILDDNKWKSIVDYDLASRDQSINKNLRGGNFSKISSIQLTSFDLFS